MPRKRRERPAPILEWIEGEPPPAKNGDRHHEKPVGFKSPVALALKTWPGRWAIVYRTDNRSSATSRASFLKRLGCEATTRKIDFEKLWVEEFGEAGYDYDDMENFIGGQYEVYARWPSIVNRAGFESGAAYNAWQLQG